MTPFCAIPSVAIYFLATLFSLIQVVVQRRWLYRSARWLFVGGVVLHGLYLVLLLSQGERFVLMSWGDGLSAVAFVMAAFFAFYNRHPRWQVLGTVVVPAVFVMFLISLPRGGEFSVLHRWLDHSLLVGIHLKTAFASLAVVVMIFIMASTRMMQERFLKTTRDLAALSKMPSLESVDRSLNTLVSVGFALLTASWASGLILGVQIRHAMGIHQVLATLSWLIFAAVFHSRHWARHLAKRGLILSMIGFLMLLVTFLGGHAV